MGNDGLRRSRTHERLYEKKFGQEAVERLYLGKSQDIRLSVTYYPSINTYQGNTKLQLVMQQYQ